MRHLSRPESLHVVADVGDRGVELPAQAVVESQLGLIFQLSWANRYRSSAANILHLGRALPERAGKPEQVVWENVSAAHVLLDAAVEKVLAADVEVESLVKALAADIATELDRVVADDLAQTVRPLKEFAHLRQFAFDSCCRW